MKKKVLSESTFLDCLELRPSSIQGNGIFTTKRISSGTEVIRWGGVIFTGADVAKGLAREHTHVGIDDDLYLAIPADRPPTLDDYMNHSCDGNIWMGDEITLIANRDIEPDEELTADYALWLNEPNYRMKKICNCGAGCCRKVIRGDDWRLSTVQLRYSGHFSPFINRLITQYTTNLNEK